MKKVFFLLVAFVMVFAIAQTASAATLPFEHMIDDWTVLGFSVDAKPILEVSNAFSYEHDINGLVNIAGGEKVVDASLQLDFTNDITDSVGVEHFPFLFWTIDVPYNNEENVRLAFDGSAWIEIGEVDNGQHELAIGISALNDDGVLDVTIDVYNALGTGSVYLDQSKLSGHYQPVPEPATMTMGLMSLIGLYVRRKFF